MIPPPWTPANARNEVVFRLCLAVADDYGQITHSEIVGDCGLMPATARIALQSPLARALISPQAGGKLTMRRPAGTLALHMQENANAVDPAFAPDR